MAALADQPYLRATVQNIEEARAGIAQIAGANGLEPLPSATNFVTIDCGRDGAFARRGLHALLERDIFVRMPVVEPLNRCIRIGAGLPKDLAIFEEMLPEALKAARQ